MKDIGPHGLQVDNIGPKGIQGDIGIYDPTFYKKYRNNIPILNDSGAYVSDSTYFIQLDLFYLIRLRKISSPVPTFIITNTKDTFSVYGSNTLGQFGTLLLSYNNETNESIVREFTIPSFNRSDVTTSGDLYKYGMSQFRYISRI